VEREREREREREGCEINSNGDKKKGTTKTSKEPRRGEEAFSPLFPRKKGVVQTSYHTSLLLHPFSITPYLLQKNTHTLSLSLSLSLSLFFFFFFFLCLCFGVVFVVIASLWVLLFFVYQYFLL